MSDDDSLNEYLILSRGKWSQDKTPEEIQAAIDRFYVWINQLVSDGKAKLGQRLGTAGKLVSQQGVTDGPFAETKEVIGGYWIFLARNLDEAAALAAQNPCMACGLSYEVRPMEPRPASAFEVTNETPTAS